MAVNSIGAVCFRNGAKDFLASPARRKAASGARRYVPGTMERFSINILRQQVYNICRLCGVDNPDKIAILSEEEEDVILVTEDEEPSLAKKIEECVGIRVSLRVCVCAEPAKSQHSVKTTVHCICFASLVYTQVHANDQMPQNVCTLCVDKVNDFYEYRLMCASTNLQTRSILNLPVVNPSISLVRGVVPYHRSSCLP